MILVFILATMFGIGCVVAPLLMARSCWNDGDRTISLGLLFLGLPVGAALAAAPWVMIAHALGPDLVTLKKSDWHCTASHSETTMVMSGKLMVPSARQVCDQYGRL